MRLDAVGGPCSLDLAFEERVLEPGGRAVAVRLACGLVKRDRC